MIPIPNGVMVELIYLIGTNRVENVYHVTRGTPATLAELQALWGTFRTWEDGTAKASRGGQASLIHIVCTALDSANAPIYEAAVIPPIVGSIVSTAMPDVVSVAIKHTSGQQGRSQRGRTYWIGLTQASIAGGGFILQAAATAFQGVYNTLRTQLAIAGWQFCVASKYSGVSVINGYRRPIPRDVGILTPITASSCETSIDTQRHRKAPHQI